MTRTISPGRKENELWIFLICMDVGAMPSCLGAFDLRIDSLTVQARGTAGFHAATSDQRKGTQHRDAWFYRIAGRMSNGGAVSGVPLVCQRVRFICQASHGDEFLNNPVQSGSAYEWKFDCSSVPVEAESLGSQ
jgi:hypothetical protein